MTSVTPWIEIARMPPYMQASSAEREAIRNLYWRICVEERIPLAQRVLAYQQFLRDSTESDVSKAPTRTTSVSPDPRLQQVAAPSPVNAGTMRRWCKT